MVDGTSCAGTAGWDATVAMEGTACGRRHPSAMHFISALLFWWEGEKIGKKIYYAAIKKHQLCCPHRKGCKQLRRAARHDREFGHCGSPLRSYGSTRQTISMCAQGAPRTQGVTYFLENYECDFFIFPGLGSKNCCFLLFEQVQFWFSQPKITDHQVTSVDRRFRLFFSSSW